MDPAIHQTLAFLSLLVIGLLLKLKIRDKKELKGIKTLILAVALPATIFVALLKIQLSNSLVFLPVWGFTANILLYLFSLYFIVPLLARAEAGSRKRTYRLLLPSFAPGLSCFPFIIEYLGDESLANAALVDVGNKVFVLIVLYLVAMRWYYNRRAVATSTPINLTQRIGSLGLSLVKEPVNAVIIIALILLGMGYHMENLPLFVQKFISRAHALTTGMVLIFIGAAFNIQRSEAQSIFSMLFVRSGVAFLLSALILYFFGSGMATNMALLVVIFPQSSCSFWPLAHMSAVDEMESKAEGDKSRTFDLQTGLNVLACSLPFSSMLILGVCTTGAYFTQSIPCILFGLLFMAAGFGLRFLPVRIQSFTRSYRREVREMRNSRNEATQVKVWEVHREYSESHS